MPFREHAFLAIIKEFGLLHDRSVAKGVSRNVNLVLPLFDPNIEGNAGKVRFHPRFPIQTVRNFNFGFALRVFKIVSEHDIGLDLED